MLAITIATLVGTVLLYQHVPKGFFPEEDTGFISGSTEANSDIGFPAMTDLQKKVAAIVQADRALETVNSTIGAGGQNASANQGRLFIKLKPRDQRGEPEHDVHEPARADQPGRAAELLHSARERTGHGHDAPDDRRHPGADRRRVHQERRVHPLDHDAVTD